MFARFGSAVTVIELLPRVLPLEDEEISNEAGKLLAKQMTIHTGAKTEGALKTANGVEVAFRAADGQAKSVTARRPAGGGRPRPGDGRPRPRVDEGAARPRLHQGQRADGHRRAGRLRDRRRRDRRRPARIRSSRTSRPRKGIGVAERLAGKDVEPVNYDQVPGATYCMPEVASVGLTEAEAKKRGYDVKIGRFNFGNIAKPRIIGQDFGLVKVVSESKYDEVLGVHMVGPHVTDLISEACVALRLESTIEELMRTIHPHPTLPEALMQAAEAVYGHAIDA